ncbi:alginate lyase family protein [Butyrivibrio fibrisolvens]|uniref:alginate lyase family protein n=1 Tax=Butyrivibrio fibrisolvens TaxID=831 RepID=UPI0004211EE5|nr:alginate lyase family protein [Butyrivibrio fibrisolvens]
MASNLNWFIKRLSAMDAKEIPWRVSQTFRYKVESVRFKKQYKVTDKLFNRKYSRLQAEPKRLGLNLRNEFYTLGTSIPLLGDFKYEDYKSDWFQGFGGEGTSPWPMIPSSKLNYRERNDIGDARMNWELNKHFQFAMLAKDYYASGDSVYLNELSELFEDWNDKNPFLWGISWVSAIEIAERCMNWCYMYSFLEAALHKEFHKDSVQHNKGKHKHKKSDKTTDSTISAAALEANTDIKNTPSDDASSIPSDIAVKIQTLLNSTSVGILNMADYISHHYSQFSSANNHLIVEISAVMHAGILFDYMPWIKLAESILTREIFLQNYSDGINKEESQYYQTFEMEVLALDLRLLRLNDIETSKSWDKLLRSMSRYISNNIGDHDEILSFGDDDDGRIIDFHGGCNHFKYTLELMGLLLDERYTELNLPTSNDNPDAASAINNNNKSKKQSKPKHNKPEKEIAETKSSSAIITESQASEPENINIFASPISETVLWLFSKEDIIKSREKSYYRRSSSIIRPEGGMTVFMSKDSNITTAELDATDTVHKTMSKSKERNGSKTNIPDILIGIDHAPLGYGSIAAHGHSDALSFQMFADGTRIFADPGTYIYHCDTESRNDFRRTCRHNTVCINSTDQSEMMGPFLWGRKATCTLDGFTNTEDIDEVMATHDGYSPIKHTRKFTFKKKEGILLIEDWLTKDNEPFVPDESHAAVFNLLLGEKASVSLAEENTSSEKDDCNNNNSIPKALTSKFSTYNFNSVTGIVTATIEFISGFGKISLSQKDLSTEYGIKNPAPAIEASIISDHAVTKICLTRK